MKITERSVELVNAPDYETLLDTVTKAGHNCYKAKTVDTQEHKEKFIRGIIKRGHEAVLEFSNIDVHIVADRSFMGQLTRHRLCHFCVSGDTIIQSFAKGKGCGKKRTIAELYRWYTTPICHAAFKALTIRSMNENNVIVPNKPIKVFYNGEQDVYKITTESGRSIKTTRKHKFATGKGYVALEKLKVGDYVYANGKDVLENEDWLRYNYLTLNKTRKEVAKLAGCCESYVYRAFKKFGIVKPYADFPNRKPGHGKKGMFTKEQREEISKRMRGANHPSFIHDRNKVSIRTGYTEANKWIKRGVCEFCGTDKNIEIHHINKNPRDNCRDNIKFLCKQCHTLWHKTGRIGSFKDKIVSIEYAGVEPVYDIEMSEPYHNYVANGFVVHNCVESARYNNYASDKNGNEIAVIVPADIDENSREVEMWYRGCAESEISYTDLISAGVRPETARSVLPMCLATSIFCGANIREWRHIFRLRCDSHAQIDIRLVMTELLAKMYEKYPVFFEDLAKEFGVVQ